MSDFTELWAEQLDAMDRRIEESGWVCGCDPLAELIVSGTAWAFTEECGWHDPFKPHEPYRTHSLDWPNS